MHQQNSSNKRHRAQDREVVVPFLKNCLYNIRHGWEQRAPILPTVGLEPHFTLRVTVRVRVRVRRYEYGLG